ncbi:MAG: hypothetical protein HFE82_04275 [Erysipelotrichaceae bacterium]|nr:hypothetical protein [Erysipelotrichaceae bacterium]
MLIACTKTAARTLNRKVSNYSGEPDPFFCWHAKVFLIEEGKMFLFMNEKTRLPLFIPAQSFGKASVQERLLDLIKAVILHMGFSESVVEQYMTHSQMHYVRVFNLSIVSQMNSLSRVYQYEAAYGTQYYRKELAAVVKYGQIPCFKYNIYPYKEFEAELRERYGD